MAYILHISAMEKNRRRKKGGARFDGTEPLKLSIKSRNIKRKEKHYYIEVR